MDFEFAFLDFLQMHRSPLADALAVFLNVAGARGGVWLALALLLMLKRRTRWTGCAVLLALALHFVACDFLLKPLFARPRPCDINTTVELLIERPNGWSFPSGHTSSAFAAAGALYARRSRLALPALLLAAAIGFSRLYLYVHFPTDVLAGALLGIVLGVLAAKLTAIAASRY